MRAAPPSVFAHPGIRGLLLTGLPLIAIALLVPGWVADPFLRSDAYPVLFGDADLYFSRTLTAGRWLNWLWAARPWPTDAHVLMALHFGLWAAMGALLGRILFPDDTAPWRALLVALAVSLAPQQASMSAWYVTMVPKAALAALMALAVSRAPERAVALLLPAVPLALMAHGTAPLLLLAICLSGLSGPRALPRALIATALFGVAFALGLLTIFALNAEAHGVFGVVIEPWRRAAPADTLAAALANLARFDAWLAKTLHAMTAGLAGGPLILGALSGAALLLLMAARPAIAAVLMLGLATGLAAVAAQEAKTGVHLPFRGTDFAWISLVAVAGASMRATDGWRTARLAAIPGLALLAALAVFGALSWRQMAEDRPPYQGESRAIAAAVAAAWGPRIERLVIAGDPRAIAGGDAVAHIFALRNRLRHLLGTPAVEHCVERRDCPGLRDRLAAMPPWPAAGSLEAGGDGALLLRLAALRRSD